MRRVMSHPGAPDTAELGLGDAARRCRLSGPTALPWWVLADDLDRRSTGWSRSCCVDPVLEVPPLWRWIPVHAASAESLVEARRRHRAPTLTARSCDAQQPLALGPPSLLGVGVLRVLRRLVRLPARVEAAGGLHVPLLQRPGAKGVGGHVVAPAKQLRGRTQHRDRSVTEGARRNPVNVGLDEVGAGHSAYSDPPIARWPDAACRPVEHVAGLDWEVSSGVGTGTGPCSWGDRIDTIRTARFQQVALA